MQNIIVGSVVLFVPYLVGMLLNVISYGKDTEFYESLGWTYSLGLFIVVGIVTFLVFAYLLGGWIIALLGV